MRLGRGIQTPKMCPNRHYPMRISELWCIFNLTFSISRTNPQLSYVMSFYFTLSSIFVAELEQIVNPKMTFHRKSLCSLCIGWEANLDVSMNIGEDGEDYPAGAFNFSASVFNFSLKEALQILQEHRQSRRILRPDAEIVLIVFYSVLITSGVYPKRVLLLV